MDAMDKYWYTHVIKHAFIALDCNLTNIAVYIKNISISFWILHQYIHAFSN